MATGIGSFTDALAFGALNELSMFNQNRLINYMAQ